MIFSVASIVLTIIPFILVGAELASNRWIRKVTNTYWFWLGIGIIYLFLCIFFAWKNYWLDLSNVKIPWMTPMSLNDSKIVSSALLLNVSSFISFGLCASLIADPTRKVAKVISPFAILSSFYSLLFVILPSQETSLSWRYFFLGSANKADLQYFGYLMNLLIGFGVLLNTPKFGWKGTIGAYGFTLGFYVYSILCSYITGTRYFVSGVRLEDFSAEGMYSIFSKIFPNLPQVTVALFFLGLTICLFVIIALSDFCKTKYFAFGDKHSECWWHYYDYNETINREPWGWFSKQWQIKHKKRNKKD